MLAVSIIILVLGSHLQAQTCTVLCMAEWGNVHSSQSMHTQSICRATGLSGKET